VYFFKFRNNFGQKVRLMFSNTFERSFGDKRLDKRGNEFERSLFINDVVLL
jgi:hypothetical protein